MRRGAVHDCVSMIIEKCHAVHNIEITAVRTRPADAKHGQ